MRDSSQRFAEQVREARAKRGWTQMELAQAANVSQSMIGLLEAGTRSPSLATAARIASALGIRARLSEYAENTSK